MGSMGWAQLVGLDGGEMGLAEPNELGLIAARWWQDIGLDGGKMVAR